MTKRNKPPFRAGRGAMPSGKDPRIWAAAAGRLAKAIGIEAFVAVVSIVVFAKAGMKSEHMVAYGLAIVWSLFAMNRLKR